MNRRIYSYSSRHSAFLLGKKKRVGGSKERTRKGRGQSRGEARNEHENEERILWFGDFVVTLHLIGKNQLKVDIGKNHLKVNIGKNHLKVDIGKNQLKVDIGKNLLKVEE